MVVFVYIKIGGDVNIVGGVVLMGDDGLIDGIIVMSILVVGIEVCVGIGVVVVIGIVDVGKVCVISLMNGIGL